MQRVIGYCERQHRKVDLVKVGVAQPGAALGHEADSYAADHHLRRHCGKGDVLDEVKDVDASGVHRARHVRAIHWRLELIEIVEEDLDRGAAGREA